MLGYSPPGQEKLSQHVYDKDELVKLRAQAPDVKENFECGREDDPIANVWLPDGVLPGFKEACLDFFWVSRCLNGVHAPALMCIVSPRGAIVDLARAVSRTSPGRGLSGKLPYRSG